MEHRYFFSRSLEMAGRFEGLSDTERRLFEEIFLKKKEKGPGMPASHPRNVLNSLLYILFIGCRWCDLPKGGQWASESSAHRRLKTWQADGTFEKLKALILGYARNKGLISRSSGAVDGSFSSGKGGGAKVAYGYKGKGILIHLLVDAQGMPLSAFSAPADEDERKHVEELLEKVEVKTGKAGRPPKKVKRLAADKGYDSNPPRDFLKEKGIQPQIPGKRNAKKDADGLYL